MSISLFVLLLVIFSAGPGLAQGNILSTEDLKEDVSALRTGLERHHPGLHWYTSKEEFSRTWDSLDRTLSQPLTDLEFFKVLLPVVAKVKCAHTLFYPSGSIMSTGTRFPIDLKVLGNRLYLMPDSTMQDIPRGSELIEINNKPASEILQELMPGLQAQGGNEGWKKVILENDFQNYYYYLVSQPDQFSIRYLDYNTGQAKSKVIAGSSDELLRKHWKNWYPSIAGPPLNIEFVDKADIAILTIKSFVRRGAKYYNQDFDKLIDQYFEKIKALGIKSLIIDVRGNEGGSKPEKLYSYIAGWNGAGERKGLSIKPAKNSFAGSVIVLANERSISAEETFVSIFKYYNRGLQVGRPTPGCFKGLCGGKKHKLVLPSSQFEIQIPMYSSGGIYNEDTKQEPGKGFPPDFHIRESIDDIVQNRDPAMVLALELIQKSQ